MKTDIEKTQNEKKALEQKIKDLELLTFKSNERLEAFKMEMNFNAKQLRQWIAEREKQEEDKRVLEKYRRQDEDQIKNLNLQIQKLDRRIFQADHFIWVRWLNEALVKKRARS